MKVLMAVAIAALPVLVAAAEKPPLTIHVFTRIDPSGLVDADQDRRSDSVRDLRGVLDKGLKEFTPVLVEDPKSARIVIEVLSSAMTDTGDRTGWNPLTGMMGSGKVVRAPIVRTRVSIGNVHYGNQHQAEGAQLEDGCV